MGRDRAPRASWFFVAVEPGAWVVFDQSLFTAPSEKSAESTEDEVSLAFRSRHGFEHDAAIAGASAARVIGSAFISLMALRA